MVSLDQILSQVLSLWELASKSEEAIEKLSDETVYGAMYVKLNQLGMAEITASGHDLVNSALAELTDLVEKFGLKNNVSDSEFEDGDE